MNFSQELVDFLNEGGINRRHEWLVSNPSLLDFVNYPHVVIRPALFHEAQRVSVTEGPHGRFVVVLKRNGVSGYLFQIENASLTVQEVEMLIEKLEAMGGSCHIEDSFLMIDLPLGHQLDLSDACLVNVIARQETAAETS